VVNTDEDKVIQNVISFMAVKKEVAYRERQLGKAIENGEDIGSINDKRNILKKSRETLRSYVTK